MEIAKTIVYLNIIVWLIPLFRQYKHGYFYFFLILGVTDPLNLLLVGLFKNNPNYIALISSYFALLAVLYYKNNLKIGNSILLLLIMSFLLLSVKLAGFGIFLFHFLIFYNFLDIFMKDYFSLSRINFYFVLLVLYESLLFIKFLLVSFNFSTGIYFFYITSAFQILLAFYFIIYDLESSPKMKLVVE